jgi:hypothetical protein
MEIVDHDVKLSRSPRQRIDQGGCRRLCRALLVSGKEQQQVIADRHAGLPQAADQAGAELRVLAIVLRQR